MYAIRSYYAFGLARLDDVPTADARAFPEQHGAQEDIFELPHVAAEPVALQLVDGRRFELRGGGFGAVRNNFV